MMQSPVEKTPFSPTRRLRFLIRLSLMGRTTDTFVGFEKRLGFSAPQPDLREVLKELVAKDILLPVEDSQSRYCLKQGRLKKYIDSLEATRLFYDYFSEHHLVVWA